MGILFAFRESLYGGGTSQILHALGYLGARLIAAQRAEKPPAPGAHALMLERLACSPTASGSTTSSALRPPTATPARHRDTAHPDPVAGLTQWWSERQCTDFFHLDLYSGETVGLRPDGYGCWEQHDRAVRFFLEYDTCTESLTILTGKLAVYQRFPTDKFGILLFSLHSSRRETTLQAALHRAMSGYGSGVVIATTARDHAHPDGPAGPVWVLWTPTAIPPYNDSIWLAYPNAAPHHPPHRYRAALQRSRLRPRRAGDLRRSRLDPGEDWHSGPDRGFRSVRADRP